MQKNKKYLLTFIAIIISIASVYFYNTYITTSSETRSYIFLGLFVIGVIFSVIIITTKVSHNLYSKIKKKD